MAAMRTGNLSINSENMLPIIKKWLYNDHDIFVREVIANGCDAISKLHKLEIMGEYEYPEGHKDSIKVIVDPDAKTVRFIDTGLGMTEEEVEKYITQIAFSGATAFLEKYKDKTNKDDIIGHFGLGFYSVFMVADEAEIDTLSYQKDAKPVHWVSDGNSEYQIGEGSWNEVGTQVTLHLNDDSTEFANKYRMEEVIEKYCSFMPVEIFLSTAKQEYETIDEKDLKDTDVVVEHIHEDAKYEDEYDDKGYAKLDDNGNIKKRLVSPERNEVRINKRPVSLSDTHPLWTKTPSECTDDEYKEFYRKVFNDYREPLFWIHLNMDYPFNLKGIIYFPKINTEYDSIEGKIKLYNNQVFIADNIKEVIPEYMMLLKGVIDCPDFPLNVSRSALQNDGFVKKISDYISKKIADKLSGMCKTQRETYEGYWEDISPFIKYGCIKDSKFDDRMKKFMLYKDIEGKYYTLEEFLEKQKKDAETKAAGAAKTDEKAREEAVAEGEAKAADSEANAAEDKAKAAEGEAAEDEAKAADGSETVDFEEEPETEGDRTEEAKAEETKAEGTATEESAAEETKAGETGSEETKSEDTESGDASAEDKKKEKQTVYYVNDETQQSQYIRMFRESGLDAVILRHNIDSAYISHVEQQDENVKFMRIDADVTSSMKETTEEDELKADTDTMSELFKKVLNKEKLTVRVEKLKDAKVSSMLTLSEEGRRMQDMMRMYSTNGDDISMFAPEETLVLNANNNLVKYLLAHKDGEQSELFAHQLYDLAAIANKPLAPAEMTDFISRSNEIMMLLAKG